MPDEVTKSLEEELDEIDDVGDVYEEESDDGASDQTDDNISDDADDQDADDEQDTTKTEEESDGEKKDSEEESVGEETSEEADTSGETESDETKDGKAESETSEDLDGQQIITGLMAEVDRLSGLLVTQTKLDSPEFKTALDAEADTESSSAMVVEKTVEKTVEDFIGDLDMDDVASKPEILNEILNKVLQKGIETGKKLSTKQTAVSVASVSKTVASQVEDAIVMKGLIDEFYGANPELSNVRHVVQACASQIVQDSPDKTFKDVLNMAADAARKTLGMPKSRPKTKIAKVEDVAFAKQKGGQRKKARKVSKLQQELDDL